LGLGVWGMGYGVLGPIPNPQSPIFFYEHNLKFEFDFKNLNIKPIYKIFIKNERSY